jgi:hypothetical protein
MIDAISVFIEWVTLRQLWWAETWKVAKLQSMKNIFKHYAKQLQIVASL